MKKERKISICIFAAGMVVASAGPAGAAYIDVVNSYDPIHYWRLGEVGGKTAFDSAAALDGKYHNGVDLGLGGIDPTDSAARFWANGKSGYVEFPHSDSLLLDSGTFDFWFQDTGTIRRAGLVSKDSEGFDSGGHLTILTDDGRLKVSLQSKTDSYFLESDPIELDRWYNVAFTFGGEGMKLYMDGVLTDVLPYTGGLGATSGGSGNFEPLVLGASTGNSGNRKAKPLTDYYSGLLDEVAVFDYQLGDAEIGGLHRAGLPEPASILLMSAGVGAMLRRRK